jgi:CheY-like chemotaxis protein
MGYRILLADDSLTIQKVVELVFAGSDWELRVAGSGDKAAALLDEFSPDVVLADAVMPGLSGYEVCEAVKKLPDGPYIPVVMLTGTFEPFDRPRADQAGADAVVTKPFDSHALVSLVRDLTDRAKEAKAAAPPPPPPAPEPEPEPAPPPVELGEDTTPTDVGRVLRAADAEPLPDSFYATSAIPIFAPAPAGPEPAADVAQPAPEPPPGFPPEQPPEPFRDAGTPLDIGDAPAPAPTYEVDLGGLEEDMARRDIEADIAEFERSGRVSGASPAFGTASAEAEADTGSVELPPHGGPLPEPSGSDLELLAARASLGDLTRLVGRGAAAERPLGDDEVERIARRVVEILGERVVRKVAWDVVPEMAERLVRERLRELERTD